MSWSETELETLRDLWGTGLSGSEIAARLPGKSRNAVIGRAHRLGLAKRASPIKNITPEEAERRREATRERRRQARARHDAKAKARKATRPVRPARRIATAERAAIAATAFPARDGFMGRTCCWPMWGDERPTHVYCGGPAVPARPYCEAHLALSIRPDQVAAR